VRWARISSIGAGVNYGRAVGWTVGAVFVACAATALTIQFVAIRDAENDELAVYCLSPAQRGALIDAAVALDLAGKSGDQLVADGVALSPAEWRAARADDFDRACAALSTATRPPRPSDLATALPFVTGVTGAVLAFVAALSVGRVSSGRERAEALRSAFDDFRRAVEAYVEGFDRDTLNAMLAVTRGALRSRLALVRTAHPRWTQVAAVERELDGAEIGAAMTEARQGDGGKLTARLSGMQNAVFQIAHSLEQPLRRHPEMRTPGGRRR
jgi:hypothetical protein